MEILQEINARYPISFDKLELLRDSGSLAYAAYSEGQKYFLRLIKPSLAEPAVTGTQVQVFLQKRGFPVPAVYLTKEGAPYAPYEGGLLVLYEFLEGEDSQPERDIEAIGTLVGRLHREMREYTGLLPVRDKQFYIGRYVDILRKKEYPKAEEYAVYGDALWEQLKLLPMGYCHGDMYSGNIRRTQEGKLYVHDFDTSCIGFPMYDAALICDATEYFLYAEENLAKSELLLERFLPKYRLESHISQEETGAFHALIAMQHFSTQATIVELFGPDCLDDRDIDGQLEWLLRWREQYELSQ